MMASCEKTQGRRMKRNRENNLLVGKIPSKHGISCPSLNLAAASKHYNHLNFKTCVCMWPFFQCPYTPAWQLFSSCKHEKDAQKAMYWHFIKKPFKIPFNMREGNHVCQWELFDHHMAGCVLCGIVHRCDIDQSEVVVSSSSSSLLPTFSPKQQQQQKAMMRCKGEQVDDGSTICLITGVCIRSCSYAVEYEVLSRQGFSAHEIASSCKDDNSSPDFFFVGIDNGSGGAGDIFDDENDMPEENNNQKRKRLSKEGGRNDNDNDADNDNAQQQNQKTKKKKLKKNNQGGGGGTGIDGIFRTKQGIMKNEFHSDKLLYNIKRLISRISQVLFAK